MTLPGRSPEHTIPSDRSRRPSTGALIVLVGPDASGKTTLGRELAAWHARNREVRFVHLGAPPQAALSRLPRWLCRAARKLMRIGERILPYRDHDVGDAPLLRGIFDVLLAYDRRALVKRCFRDVDRGLIVIADRFPGRSHGAATGPRIPSGQRRFLGWLAALERRIYRAIPDPHLVVRLRVPVEETVRRNSARPNPKPTEVVRASHEEAAHLRFPSTPELEVDNSRSRTQVLKEVKEVTSAFLALREGASGVASPDGPLQEEPATRERRGSAGV